MLDGFRESAAVGLPHAVHVEHDALCEYFKARAIERGWTRPEHHNLGRPELCEIVSAGETLSPARAAGARLHLVHMRAPEAITMAARARESGQAVTIETCPQYLLFSSEDMTRFGPFGKVHPPLRSPESRDRLWELVHTGTIDVIATDHTPFPASQRAPYGDDIWKASGGHPGLETMLPALLTQVNAGRIQLERLVALTSEHPARILGLYPRKGAIQPGADADLTLVDLERETVLRAETLFTKARAADRWFDGMAVRGVPVTTLVRGTVVYDSGRITVEPRTRTLRAPHVTPGLPHVTPGSEPRRPGLAADAFTGGSAGPVRCPPRCSVRGRYPMRS
jgi:dihydroorotase-like cyclic amidohydrolase